MIKQKKGTEATVETTGVFEVKKKNDENLTVSPSGDQMRVIATVKIERYLTGPCRGLFRVLDENGKVVCSGVNFQMAFFGTQKYLRRSVFK